ncbi:nucleobase:cation symporter-2 family protein [Amycolatopsis sp. NPDC059021]|uniref:nucleobase:cation symporter-2 family protein n=1 Tax=Amycolatopsis sp. NPDC059021 TaxID=3346704 RepID=UPI00366F606D
MRIPHSRSRTAHRARPEDERPPVRRQILYGLQHILSMYGGVIAVPLIIGGATGLPPERIALLVTAALFVSGAATILQTVGVPFFGSQLPLVQGISFASVATMTAIAARGGGLSAVFGSIIVASLIGLVLSPFFSQLIRFFPPVVTGSIITVIGVSLLPVSFRWAMGGTATAPDYGSVSNIALAGATFLIVLLVSRLLQGLLSRLSILLGIVAGTLVAFALGKTDFSGVGHGPVVALPQVLPFGAPAFSVSAIVSMTVVILVTMIETTADIVALGEIVETEVSPRRVGDGLRADMLSSAVAPLFGSFPCTAFAQNVGLVALTRVKSRYVVATGGLILVVLGLLPVLGRVAAAIPQPVLGGAGIVLFGVVAASGIRTLAKVDYDNNLNLVIVASALGFGIIPIAVPGFWSHFPGWFATIMDSGISSASVVAVVLNVAFNETRALRKSGPSTVAAAPSPGTVARADSPDGTTETG